MRRRIISAAQVGLLAASVGAAVHFDRASDWHPLAFVILLGVLAVGGDRLTINLRNHTLTAGFVPFVLAMTLCGPGPAAVMGTAVCVVFCTRLRLEPLRWLAQLSTFATFSVGGAVLSRLVIDPTDHGATRSVGFGLLVFGVFFASNATNFLLIAADKSRFKLKAIGSQIVNTFVPLLPSQLAAGALAAILAVAYTNLGYPILLGLVLLLAIYQYLAVALLRSEERADQLEARSIRLASLQLGVLTTLVETLALRDRSASRHAAAVARYARDLAEEVGRTPEEVEIVHTAGLLHDIGKFALPDRLLHAAELSEAEQAVVRRHPQEGAALVGRLDGYGPVADIILYHHESVDGLGYPAGLIGSEIPVLARILAVGNLYDRLTARDTSRMPLTHQDAVRALRETAGKRLDAELVDAFVAMLERGGPIAVSGETATFEAELAFERRARAIASPAPA